VKKLTITLLLLIPIIINAGTYELCYEKMDGNIWNNETVASTSASTIPYHHTRRMAQGVIRIENAPASWSSVILNDYKLNLTVLGSSTIILAKNHVATTTVFYQGSDGYQINFNSIDYQPGIIEPK